MFLTELYEKVPSGYQDLKQDNTQLQPHDMRKTRLTLFQINKLRQLNDIRKYEQKQKIQKIKQQYSPQQEAPVV